MHSQITDCHSVEIPNTVHTYVVTTYVT
jgi:hypothetical protein